MPCFWQVCRIPRARTFSGQLGEATASLCRFDLPPVVPPVVVWSTVEKLAGVFSGSTQAWEGPQAGLYSFQTCEHWQLCHLGDLQVARLASLFDLGKPTAAEWAPGPSHCASGSPPYTQTHTNTHTHQWGKGGGTVASIHALWNSFILPITFKKHHFVVTESVIQCYLFNEVVFSLFSF